jgi:hypothetical protein
MIHSDFAISNKSFTWIACWKKMVRSCKNIYFYFTESNYHNDTPYKSIVFILPNQSYHNDTIQKHCFYFTQSKLPQWHHTKAVFLFYPIKATTMTPYKSIVFILHNQTTIWKSQENDWVNTGIVYFTVCLITEIYQDMSFSFHDADSSKYRNKTNLILKK